MKSLFNAEEFLRIKKESENNKEEEIVEIFNIIENYLSNKMQSIKFSENKNQKNNITLKSKISINKRISNETFENIKQIYKKAGFNNIEYLEEKIINKIIPGHLIKFNDNIYIETPTKKNFDYKFYVILY